MVVGFYEDFMDPCNDRSAYTEPISCEMRMQADVLEARSRPIKRMNLTNERSLLKVKS